MVVLFDVYIIKQAFEKNYREEMVRTNILFIGSSMG